MNDAKIPVRYSKALFELSVEKDILDRVYGDMVVIRNLCSMKEIRDVLNNPVISSSKRREIFGAVLGTGADPLTLKFLDLVFNEGREKYLGIMALDFISATRAKRGIREVTITTCRPVSDTVRSEIAAMIEKGMKAKVELIEKCDTSLVGGFILKVDDMYVDASVKSRLNRFRKEFALSYSK